MITIDYKKIRDTDVSYFNKHGIDSPPADHYYRLLAYITNLFDGITILDVGTSWGYSCLSLAQNEKNKIITYDIEGPSNCCSNKDIELFNDYKNVTRKILDINQEDADIINSAKFIFFDIVHDGIQEKLFSDTLDKIGYKGYVLCDDVFSTIYPRCAEWWASLTVEKYDIREFGYPHGTGLINYYKDNSVIINKD